MTLRAPALALALLLTVTGLAGARGAPGVESWRVSVGGKLDAGRGSYLTPLPGGRVLAATSAGMFAFDGTGRQIWRRTRPRVQAGAPGASVPVVGPDRRLYLVGPDRTIVLSPATGRTIGSSPAMTGARVSSSERFTSVPYRLRDGSARVAARFPRTPFAPWSRSLSTAAASVSPSGRIVWSEGLEVSARLLPAVAGGVSYGLSSGPPGPGEPPPASATRVVARSLATGAHLWSRPAASGLSPVADARGPYVATPGLAVSAFSRSGSLRWSVVDPFRWRGRTSPVLVARGRLLVMSGRSLGALDTADGRVVWRMPKGGPDRVLRSVVVSGPRIFLLNNGGHMRSVPFPAG